MPSQVLNFQLHPRPLRVRPSQSPEAERKTWVEIKSTQLFYLHLSSHILVCISALLSHHDFSSHTSDMLQPNKIFQCKWESCTYMGYFSRDHELIRHIKTKHVNPGAYRCPVNGCDKVSNRKDNLKQHMMTRHQLF